MKLIVLLLLLAGTGTASAQQWYQVELILFEHVNPGFDGEDVYRDPGLAPLTGTVRPVPILPAGPELQKTTTTVDQPYPENALIPYALLPESEYKLPEVYQMLRRAPDYRPRYHVAWMQPGYDGNRARALHLQQEDSDSLFELTIPPALVTDPLPTEFYEPVKLLLDGTVRIRSGSLLHVDLDMVLFRPPVSNITLPPNLSPQMLPTASITEKPAEFVRLTETRRIRLNELVYFDHPKFGVIIQVSRYEPEPVTQPQTVVPGT